LLAIRFISAHECFEIAAVAPLLIVNQSSCNFNSLAVVRFRFCDPGSSFHTQQNSKYIDNAQTLLHVLKLSRYYKHFCLRLVTSPFFFLSDLLSEVYFFPNRRYIPFLAKSIFSKLLCCCCQKPYETSVLSSRCVGLVLLFSLRL